MSGNKTMVSNMKITVFIVLTCLFARTAYSQYYYNDLVMTSDIIKKRALFLQQRVRAVQMTSLDNNNQPIEGFTSSQEVSNNFTTLKCRCQNLKVPVK